MSSAPVANAQVMRTWADRAAGQVRACKSSKALCEWLAVKGKRA